MAVAPEASHELASNNTADFVQEADELLTALYYLDCLHEGQVSPELYIRRPLDGAMQMKLERLGGSVTILALWDENDDFKIGRRTVRAGDVVTQRHDFTAAEIDVIMMQELRDIRTEADPERSPSWKGPWA